VVKTPALSFDTGKSHNQEYVHITYD
jgi:hypothetical protein